jgi:hypothetical protein
MIGSTLALALCLTPNSLAPALPLTWTTIARVTSAVEPGEPSLDQDSSALDVLAALERSGRDIASLSCEVQLNETDNVTGASPTRSGTIRLLRTPDQTRLHVDFTQTSDGQRIRRERIEYLLVDGWVIERDHQTKREIRRQLRAPGETFDPLQLGQGPLPLPIGQPVDQVTGQFDVIRVPPDSGDESLVFIELRPKRGTELFDRFESVTLGVDPGTQLPLKVVVVDATQPVVTTTRISRPIVNAPMDSGSFQTASDPAEWEIITEAFRS